MSTLAEIEAAADTLPLEQQAELLAYLEKRLRGARGSAVAVSMPFRLSRRGFPISKGQTSFSSEDVDRMEADVDEAT